MPVGPINYSAERLCEMVKRFRHSLISADPLDKLSFDENTHVFRILVFDFA